MVYWSGSAGAAGCWGGCSVPGLIAAGCSRVIAGRCPPVPIPLHPTAVTERWDTLWGDLQLALASPEMCELCITPVSLRPAMVNPWKQPYQNCEKMPAFPAIFLFKAEPYSKRLQSCSPNYTMGLSEKSCNRATSLWRGRLMPLGLSLQEWTAPCSTGVWRTWVWAWVGSFGLQNEHVWEMHIERNSIYFVQGRIPSHSEQIYYKSVLP